jgi:hypothetical protein
MMLESMGLHERRTQKRQLLHKLATLRRLQQNDPSHEQLQRFLATAPVGIQLGNRYNITPDV